ncbi:MAG: LapA family protein [Nitrospirota bacterium]|nr:LapA family protein [Nitrospirota bacterium]MDE3117617.1 LapA family protein [Nitrospirota bacterium]MDE3226229.1 LapA family protein [Nitrospirota bacterium]MDE3241209.1 LapA family protein [Nitrospirota bacterium]
MIRLILVGILLLLSLTFFLQNQEQEVTLRYFFGLREATTELWRPVLSAFAVGLLVASILLFPAWVQVRLELRRKVKALQEAEADLERLRRPPQTTDRPLLRTGDHPFEKPARELSDD